MEKSSTNLRYETHDTPLRILPPSEEHTNVVYSPSWTMLPPKTVPKKMGYFYVDDYEPLPVEWDYLKEKGHGGYTFNDDEASMPIISSDDGGKSLALLPHE